MPRPSHFELPADDPERAIRFYSGVFGWSIQKWDGPMDYWLVDTGPDSEPGIHGGIARRGPGETGVIHSITVPDLDAAVIKVQEHGGTVIRPKMAVPGVGWLAYCQDTEGTTFGMMQDDPGAGQ